MIKLQPALELYLVRNGETEGNLHFQLQGQTNGRLSEKGKKQALLVGKELVKINATKIYCSRLLRARETCELAFPNIKSISIDLIKEREFGSLTNKTYFDMINIPPEERPLNGESLVDLRKRAKSFLDLISMENEIGDKIIVFSHHEIILSCIAHIVGLPLENFRKLMISNASITQLDYYNGKWVVKRVNELGHLGDLKQTERSY